MSRRLSLQDFQGEPEPDHSPEESKSLRHFLRPINPNPDKVLADWHRKSMLRERKKARLTQGTE